MYILILDGLQIPTLMNANKKTIDVFNAISSKKTLLYRRPDQISAGPTYPYLISSSLSSYEDGDRNQTLLYGRLREDLSNTSVNYFIYIVYSVL